MIGDPPILSLLHIRAPFFFGSAGTVEHQVVSLKRREKIGIGHEDTHSHSSQTSGWKVGPNQACI